MAGGHEVIGQAEGPEALKAANARLERAERIARIGHWVSYPASGELIWSSMTYELCGFSAQVAKPDLAALIERIPPEDRHQVAEYQFQANPQLSSCEGVYRVRHPDGHTLWVREVAQHYHDPEGRWIVQGTLQDITDYQEALLALRQRERWLGELQPT
ncbi:PAS domain-containing protein [Halorhodospira halophila]|uniref:PAS domain-containing protein n=1 Tax=Halorhodospira halophila TaxID=1053 RepID=UPI001912ABB5